MPPSLKRLRSIAERFTSRASQPTPFPLRWRSPWSAWQGASWFANTLLAPPFTVVGILLLINAHSDCPYFWPSAMAVVAFTNAVAIVDANQRHHRRPFGSRARIALRYFGVSAFVGSALFMMLVWGTGILEDVAGPLMPTDGTAHIAGSLTQLQLTLTATAAFCVLSFVHASVLHAWLAFEVPIWHRISRGTFAYDRAEREDKRVERAVASSSSTDTRDKHKSGPS
ncbi:hypothetical protein [Paraburkholderia humisilvae]|uniref:Uncharacterized protein n=1 Tax=Paraburkholderia humisilvae TaxID=627669 RepID=A0A6J5DMA0_9BURK|nr:hypothetical protein [Paraburkholderia humisilvae]CAB3755309.1 hypothetical protein LMG29542_02556 [Paraburkholderia humisilvae]